MLLAAPSYAQNAVALRGQVVDETGAVIPGAQITLVSATGKRRTATANAAGEFALNNVTPGDYKLTVTSKGFQLYTDNELQLTETTAPLKITLAIAPVQMETTVTADQPGISVEPDNNMNSTVLDEQFIQTLPDNEDNMLAFLQAMAGPAASGAMGGQGGGMNGPGGAGRGPGGGGGGRGGGFGGGSAGEGRFNLQLIAQLTNLLNHVNYGQYSGVISSPFFDKSSSAAAARAFELGIRFNF
jgi:hypothetical protein